MRLAVSACLLGHACKYNGGSNHSDLICDLQKQHTIIPICPEVMGGLPTPRIPCERVEDKVLDRQGNDRTAAFASGAQKALERIQKEGVDLVILQPRSPSCGIGTIYDGKFSGNLIPGNGVFVDLLRAHNIPCISGTRQELEKAGLLENKID